MKKKILIAGIVVVLMVVFYIIGKVAPPASKDNSDSSSSQIQSSLNSSSKADSASNSSQNVQNTNFGWDPSTSSTETGSSARVDEILSKAMDDAKNIPDDADSQYEEALGYLKEHTENFYESNEIMEKSMYYGCFIYSYIEDSTEVKNISELNDKDRTKYDAGYNVVKAIKYVYRGAETAEGESAQNALKEAQDALNKIN